MSLLMGGAMKTFICMTFLGFTVLAFSTARGQNAQLLVTGKFHGNEVTAQSGEIWYGLYNEVGRFRLVSTTVKVEAVHDDMVIEKEGEKTGKKVSAEHEGSPLFMVRGIDRLEEREVETVFNGKKFFFPGEMMRVGEITVIAFGDLQEPKPRWSPSYRNYSIQLKAGRPQKYYLLAEYPRLAAFDEIPYLVWAGDIDNDGRIDMFWDMTDHYNKRQKTLFLSSMALTGELLHKCAEFIFILD